MSVVWEELFTRGIHLVHLQSLLHRLYLLESIDLPFSLWTLCCYEGAEQTLWLFDFNLPNEFSAVSTIWLDFFTFLIDKLDKGLSVGDQTYCK